MAHDVRSPHIFVDGPGHTASGDEVMDNFDALWAVIDTLVSPGTIRLSGAASPETGWLLCDGSAVSRTTYATLFGKLGTAFGTGDGSTTFNLPDLRGRAPIGVGTGSGLTARAMGVKVGGETSAANASTVGADVLTTTGTSVGVAAAGADIDIHHGSGAGIAAMQPSQAVNFFIKT